MFLTRVSGVSYKVRWQNHRCFCLKFLYDGSRVSGFCKNDDGEIISEGTIVILFLQEIKEIVINTKKHNAGASLWLVFFCFSVGMS